MASSTCVYDGNQATVLMMRCRAISHNPQAYRDPDAFNPDRFLTDDQMGHSLPDPSDYAFGFGRR